eukprot:992140-Rhodomonas_salina.1
MSYDLRTGGKKADPKTESRKNDWNCDEKQHSGECTRPANCSISRHGERTDRDRFFFTVQTRTADLLATWTIPTFASPGVASSLLHCCLFWWVLAAVLADRDGQPQAKIPPPEEPASTNEKVTTMLTTHQFRWGRGIESCELDREREECSMLLAQKGLL